MPQSVPQLDSVFKCQLSLREDGSKEERGVAKKEFILHADAVGAHSKNKRARSKMETMRSAGSAAPSTGQRQNRGFQDTCRAAIRTKPKAQTER